MAYNLTTLASTPRSSKLARAYLRAKLNETSLMNKSSSLSFTPRTSSRVCAWAYMLPPSPVAPWIQWSNELAREMYVKHALQHLSLQYPNNSADS